MEAPSAYFNLVTNECTLYGFTIENGTCGVLRASNDNASKGGQH